MRVGNAAVEQLQLDIYGELIDSVYLFNKYGAGISHDAWEDLTRILDWLCDNWDRDDAGMWEIRGEPRPYTTSRLMCWVAIERMIRMARQRGLPGDIVELVAGARRDLRPDHGARAGTTSSAPSSRSRAATRWTPACC